MNFRQSEKCSLVRKSLVTTGVFKLKRSRHFQDVAIEKSVTDLLILEMLFKRTGLFANSFLELISSYSFQIFDASAVFFQQMVAS